MDQSNYLVILKNFQDYLLQKTILRGIVDIRDIRIRKLSDMVSKSPELGKYVRADRWVLDTTGTNLLGILQYKHIDSTRTFSNDIREMHHVLGIEAARSAIYNEIYDVMEFSNCYIDSHHLSVLADRMTLKPSLVAIFRSGILNDDIGPVAKATFEVHTEEILSAARHGELDPMRGVSANVMVGQRGYFGTGAFQVTQLPWYVCVCGFNRSQTSFQILLDVSALPRRSCSSSINGNYKEDNESKKTESQMAKRIRTQTIAHAQQAQARNDVHSEVELLCNRQSPQKSPQLLVEDLVPMATDTLDFGFDTATDMDIDFDAVASASAMSMSHDGGGMGDYELDF